MRIGLMGAVINNTNMGCVALTYSILSILEKIGNKEFHYAIFEFQLDDKKVEYMCNRLKIDRSRVEVFQYGSLNSIKGRIRHFFANYKMINELRKCNCVIDLTQGDSFSDIYGDERFESWTAGKELVEELGVPLILGPQTYGPFKKQKNLKRALKVIDNAELVISRDSASVDYLQKYIHKEIFVTTDLAFVLPYIEPNNVDSSRILVGLNISGLLIHNKAEDTDINFDMKTDYDEYIMQICNYLSGLEGYEVHLIPHVSDDIIAIKKVASQFPDFIMHDVFKSPIDAKNCISEMDIFIGARMHACIAAFSSGVATIPTAYSRKFKGVFDEYNYDYVVDLYKLETNEAFNRTIILINDYIKLKECLIEKRSLYIKKNSRTMDLLNQYIKECQ